MGVPEECDFLLKTTSTRTTLVQLRCPREAVRNCCWENDDNPQVQVVSYNSIQVVNWGGMLWSAPPTLLSSRISRGRPTHDLEFT